MPEGAPRGGDRFPWLKLKLAAGGPVEDLYQKIDDMRLHLIVIGQAAPAAATVGGAGFLDVHAIPADPVNDAEFTRAKIPGTSYYLLRPDGHIGFCGAHLQPGQVERYLSERLRLGTTLKPRA
jgi:hypothetical protein